MASSTKQRIGFGAGIAILAIAVWVWGHRDPPELPGSSRSETTEKTVISDFMAKPGNPGTKRASGYCIPCGGPKSDGDLPGAVPPAGPRETSDFALTGRSPTYLVPPSTVANRSLPGITFTEGSFVLLIGAKPTRLTGKIRMDEKSTARLTLDPDQTRLARQDEGSSSADSKPPTSTHEILRAIENDLALLFQQRPIRIELQERAGPFTAIHLSDRTLMLSLPPANPASRSFNELILRVNGSGNLTSIERICTIGEVEHRYRLISWLEDHLGAPEAP